MAHIALTLTASLSFRVPCSFLFVCPIISSFVRETSYILGTYVTTHGCYLIIVELVYTVV